MNESINLNTFPKNELEALAILYVKTQNIEGLSVDGIYSMYLDALYALKEEKALKIRDGYFREREKEVSEIKSYD